jgi:single-stranded-DNA-specific exonuclease
LRLKLRSRDGAAVEGIAFRAVGQPLGQALAAAKGEVVHVAGQLGINRWNGSERAQLRVSDVAKP